MLPGPAGAKRRRSLQRREGPAAARSQPPAAFDSIGCAGSPRLAGLPRRGRYVPAVSSSSAWSAGFFVSIACSMRWSGPITKVTRLGFFDSRDSHAPYATPTSRVVSHRSGNWKPSFSANARFCSGVSNEMP